MPTATLLPDAVGNYDQWALGAGASKTAAANTDDSDTSYVRSLGLASGEIRQTFTLGSLPAGAALVSGSLTLLNKTRMTGDAMNVRELIRQNSTDAESSNHAISSTSYADTSNAFTTAPDGSAWTVAKVNSTEGGIRAIDDPAGGNSCRLTYCRATISYTLAGGFLQWWFMEWLGPVFGAALTMRDAYAMARAFNAAARGRHRLHPEEFRDVWRDFREARWPVRVFLRPSPIVGA